VTSVGTGSVPGVARAKRSSASAERASIAT
jgi:hypothetical protein